MLINGAQIIKIRSNNLRFNDCNETLFRELDCL